MMLVPRRNSFDLFDELFDEDLFPKHEMFKKEKNLMKTDIKEKKDRYILDIDLPGFDKENITLSLNDGYLNIHAKVDKEINEEEKYVRQERFHGECSRSFYIGEDIKENEIKADFKNGILKIELPKKEIENKSNDVKQIPIN